MNHTDYISPTKKSKMKYKITLLVLAIYCNTYAQKELTFKINYSPETSYIQTITQSAENNMTYSGSEEFIQKLKEKKVQNPTVTNTSSTIKMNFKTGKLNAQKYFPLTMEFLKINNSDIKKTIPEGTTIYGRGTIDKMPELDSIVANGMDDDFKKSLLQTMQSTLAQIFFPTKKVKVGEDFSQTTPLSIPTAGNTLEMTIETNYKLISIDNNLGHFDVIQTYKVISNISKYEITASGSGKGELVYDIKNNFLLKYKISN